MEKSLSNKLSIDGLKGVEITIIKSGRPPVIDREMIGKCAITLKKNHVNLCPFQLDF